MQLLDDCNRLVKPLYHGTCSVFAESIARTGLGAANPVAELEAMEFLRNILPVCRSVLASEPDWPLEELILGPILRQEVTRGGFNYRHGSTYLTPSMLTAARYARNPYGSELISTAIKLFERLAVLTEPPSIVAELRQCNLLRLRRRTRTPILVVASSVPLSALRKETGGDAAETISEMRDRPEFVWQQLNFELTTVLDVATLEFFEVASDDPLGPIFDYTLIPWCPEA